MASNTTVELKVLLKSVGIKATTKQLETLAKQLKGVAAAESKTVKSAKKATTATKKLGEAANKTKRNLEGVAQRSGSTAKDFSRMSQGMGGLVQAYATIAANVFAISSAFLVLRKAADLSSMMKSAENFSDQFGISVSRITKQMQEASGGALDFAEALPSINKAVAAGIGISDMEKLTVAATKASQTFGGSTTEALNRFISASQRGRVEIIQTLGIVIKTEQAYKNFAVSVGKTALELTAADRQQAILNATIAESERIFKDIKIDPNPFTQFASTMIDLKDTILTVVTDGVTPLLSLFNQSLPAALIVMGVVLKSIAGKAFPLFENAMKNATAAGIASSRAVTVAQIKARNIRIRNISQEVIQVRGLKEKEIRQKFALINSAKREELLKAGIHLDKLYDKNGKANRKAFLQLKAHIGRIDALRAKGTIQKGTEGLTNTDTKNIRNLAAVGAVEAKLFKAANKDQANYSKAVLVSTNRVREWGRTIADTYGRARITIASTTSAMKSGFASTFASAQSGLGGLRKAIMDTNRAWRIFVRDINLGSTTIQKSMFNIGKVAGRGLGLLAGGLAAVIGPIFTFALYLGLLKVAFDALSKKFNTAGYKLKQLKEATKEFKEELEEAGARVDKHIKQTKNNEKSTQGLISRLEFLRGTIDSVSNAFEKFDDKMAKIFGGITIFDDFTDKLVILEDRAENLAVSIKNIKSDSVAGQTGSQIRESIRLTREWGREYNTVTKKVEELKTNIKLTEKAAKRLVKSGDLNPMITNFSKLNQVLLNSGISGLQDKTFAGLGKEFDGLKEAMRFGNEKNILTALSSLDEAQIHEWLMRASKAAQEFKEKLIPLNSQITALKSLLDVELRFGNYLEGIDKLKNASVPNKEIINFLLDTTTALKTLEETGSKKILGNLGDLEEEYISSDQLKGLKDILGISEGATIGEAFDQAEAKLRPFMTLIETALTTTIKLKTEQLLLSELKAKVAKSDSDRLDILKRTHASQARIRNLELNLSQSKLASLYTEKSLYVSGEKTDKKRYDTLLKEIDALKEEIEIRNRINLSIEERDRLERDVKPIELDQEVNKVFIEQINLTNQALKIREDLTYSATAYLAIQKNIYKGDLASLKLKKDNIDKQIEILKIKKDSYDFDREKELESERLKLDLIEAQILALERLQHSRRASELENSGVSIFSKQGLSEAANFFVDAVDEKAKKLKSTFEILGKGFAKNLFDTFDKAVDTLLEGVWGHGGRAFGRAMLETIKAGLRETIGEAVKARIKESLAGLFGGVSKTDPVQQAIEAGNTTAEAAKEELIKIKEILAKGPKDSEIPDVASVLKEDRNPFKPLTDILENNDKSIKDVASKIEKASEIAKVGNEIAQQGFLMNLKQLFVIGWAIIKQAASSVASGFMSLFGLAKGGIIPGKSPIMQHAQGTVTRGPQLALIGEGSRNEAVVPLPNNREIPVDMKGASGDTINIEQNFDFRNADNSAIPRLRAEARAIEDRTFNRVFSEINKGGRYAKIVGRR